MKEARFYEMEGSVAYCRLCPHVCSIPDGKAGLCGVRRNRDGALWAESYGSISSLAVDPIEKKPLLHFHPGRCILSAGSYGCNMRCGYCQNSGISLEIPPTRHISPAELTKMAMAQEDNLGLAFTYNEPLVAMEYLLDVAPLLKDAGLMVVLVTNGMVMPEPLTALLPYVDAMNIDVKRFTADGYRSLGGNLDAVKETVALCAKACHVEVTNLIVPGENDGEAEMTALSEWIASLSPNIPLHITRFFPRYRMADKPPTPVSTLFRLSEVAKRSLTRVGVGNV